MTDDHTLTALHQIAQALGVPVSILYNSGLSSSLSPSAHQTLEIYELLEAFALITDPKVRRDSIEFVRKAGTL